MSKMDFIDIWMHDTNTDILVLSETWLNDSIVDIDISNYNIFDVIGREKVEGGNVKSAFVESLCS
jgi:hypothetical protein